MLVFILFHSLWHFIKCWLNDPSNDCIWIKIHLQIFNRAHFSENTWLQLETIKTINEQSVHHTAQYTYLGNHLDSNRISNFENIQKDNRETNAFFKSEKIPQRGCSFQDLWLFLLSCTVLCFTWSWL